MRWIILFLLIFFTSCLYASEFDQECEFKIILLVDVSGSVLYGNADNPHYIKDNIKSAMRNYLFKYRSSCVSIYKFATYTHKICDFVSLKDEENKDMLLSLVEDLTFEKEHPFFYTNWEDALLTIDPLADQKTSIYIITDGNPTAYKGIPEELLPSDDSIGNIKKAIDASKSLIEGKGSSVIPIGVGPYVSESNLLSISGPCGIFGCIKGWNYFHVTSFEKFENPIEGSIVSRHFQKELNSKSETNGALTLINPDMQMIYGDSKELLELDIDVFKKVLITGESDFIYDSLTGEQTTYSLKKQNEESIAGILITRSRIHKRAEGSGLCMEDLFGGTGLTCSANDLGIAFVTLLNGNRTCELGETVTVNLGAFLQPNAVQRYDIAITLAKDGGTGLTGDCANFNLEPASVDNTDLDVLGGFGPFFNGETGTGDVCGDIRNTDGLNFVNLGNVTILCTDSNMDGFADLNGGVGWDNSASSGKGNSPHCLGPDDARPGTASKCRFNLIDVEGLVVVNGTLAMGACCLPFDDTFSPLGNTTCINVLTEQDCIEVGGYFNGLNTTCANVTCTCEDEDRIIDFTNDWLNRPIEVDDLLNNAYDGWNIHFDITDGSGNQFIAFNSSDPSCGDFDLGSPNQDFGGPGIGTGGSSGQLGENRISHGMIGIINNSTAACSPQHSKTGGEIMISFPTASSIHWIGILDSEANQTVVIEIFQDLNLNIMTKNITILNLGNNSFQNVTIDSDCVRAIMIYSTNGIGITSMGITRTCPGFCPLPPTPAPTDPPTETPTNVPTNSPTNAPTNAPTETPTNAPTNTTAPTEAPTETPTNAPTNTTAPTEVPTNAPTEAPTNAPTNTTAPTEVPTNAPTEVPTNGPTEAPTNTTAPTETPTNAPTNTAAPTDAPTDAPVEESSAFIWILAIGTALVLILLLFVLRVRYRYREVFESPPSSPRKTRIIYAESNSRAATSSISNSIPMIGHISTSTPSFSNKYKLNITSSKIGHISIKKYNNLTNNNNNNSLGKKESKKYSILGGLDVASIVKMYNTKMDPKKQKKI